MVTTSTAASFLNQSSRDKVREGCEALTLAVFFYAIGQYLIDLLGPTKESESSLEFCKWPNSYKKTGNSSQTEFRQTENHLI